MSSSAPAAVDSWAQDGAQLAAGLAGGTVPRTADGTETVVTGADVGVGVGEVPEVPVPEVAVPEVGVVEVVVLEVVVPEVVVPEVVVPEVVVPEVVVVVGPGTGWRGVTEPVAFAGGPGQVMAIKTTARAPTKVRNGRVPTFEVRRAEPKT
jgi:hypothetical protein